MSQYGLNIAKLVANSQKSFNSKIEAESYLFNLRDEILRYKDQFNSEYENLILDYSVESLKRLEKFYFGFVNNEIVFKNLTIEILERFLSIYTGQVYATRANWIWNVKPDAFGDNKYILFVSSQNNLISIECNRLTNHYKAPDNKRKQLIYREFIKYSGYNKK